MRYVLLTAIACALIPTALPAQTAPTGPPMAAPRIGAPITLPPKPNGPLGDPAPIDGAKGIDNDVLCLAAVIGPSTEEKKAGKPDEMLDGAVNYFLGRIAARQDRDTFLANLAKATVVKFDKQTTDTFSSACLRRYLMAQMDVMFALSDAMSKNEPK